MIDALALEKALNAVKTLMTLAVALNAVVLICGIANYIQGGKFNANLK